MAYTQNPGRSPFLKTGNGIPSALLQKKKPDFKGSTDKTEAAGGNAPGMTANTDLLKVAKYYGGKVIDKVKQGGQYLSDLAEGKKGNSESETASGMREKKIAKKKTPPPTQMKKC